MPAITLVSGISAVPSALQPETINWRANVLAAGGSPSAATLAALDQFVSQGKTDGWWSSLIDVYPFCGPNLASALCKLKYSAASGPRLTNVTVSIPFPTSGYAPDVGCFGVQANTVNTGYRLNTGCVPSANGCSSTNFSAGFFTGAEIDNQLNIGTFFTPAQVVAGSGTAQVWMSPGAVNLNTYGGYGAGGASRQFLGFTISPSAWAVVFKHLQLASAAAGWSVDTIGLNNAWQFFGGANSGNDYPASGSVAFGFIGTALTLAQLRQLGKAVLNLQTALGRGPFGGMASGGRIGFHGDSITNGSSTAYTAGYAQIAAKKAGGAECWNLGVASSVVGSDNTGGAGTGQLSLLNLHNMVLEESLPPMIIFAGGTNDIALDTGGNRAALQTNYNIGTFGSLTDYIYRGVRALVVIPNYRGSTSGTSDATHLAWCSFISGLCRTWNPGFASGTLIRIPCVDAFTLFRALGTTAANALLASGIVHPNTDGHRMLGNAVGGALQGAYSIVFSAPAADGYDVYNTFPNAAAGTRVSSNTNGTIPVYGVVPGDPVSVVPLAASQLEFSAVVTANDTVTVYAFNPTAGLIAGANIPFKLTIGLPN